MALPTVAEYLSRCPVTPVFNRLWRWLEVTPGNFQWTVWGEAYSKEYHCPPDPNAVPGSFAQQSGFSYIENPYIGYFARPALPPPYYAHETWTSGPLGQWVFAGMQTNVSGL